MPKLSESEIAEMLAEHPEWELDSESGAIVRNSGVSDVCGCDCVHRPHCADCG